MNWLDLAIGVIEKFEGCRLHAYPDPVSHGDPWTVGFGATGPDIKPGTVWTQQQADDDLATRLEAIGLRLDALMTGTDDQKAACASFSYNCGLGAFGGSTILRKHNSGDFAGAADAFLLWTRAAGVVVQGLVNRRKAERLLYLSEV